MHVRTTGRCGGRPSGHLPVVRYLVEEAGANVHAGNDYALRMASWNGHTETVKALLDQGAPTIDSRQADTAIFYSVTNCQRGLAGVHLEVLPFPAA